ncbi:MAG TPA: copper chaperone PCu(A)C [Devosia sp.]|nr:copper chaperone PCu(A)C [Devosia sp.]
MTLRLSAIALAFTALFTSALPSFAQDAHAGHSAEVIVLGSIEITGAFSRATLPNAPVGGGFMTITNKGAEDDRLVSVKTDIAKEAQIHEMAMEGDVMKMRQLKDGLALPAGETVTLEPGGLHLMFMGLNGAIKEGDLVPVTLTFERAGTVTVDLVAGATAADAPVHGGMSHE